MTIAPETFRATMATMPTAVAVVTAVDAAGHDAAMTVSAVVSLSLTPPLLMVSIGDDATIAESMRAAARFGVSVLADDQQALSVRFAERAMRRIDDLPHTRGPGGTALLAGAVAHLECRIVARHPGGDHTMVVGEVVHAAAFDRPPLVHHRGAYRRIEA